MLKREVSADDPFRYLRSAKKVSNQFHVPFFAPPRNSPMHAISSTKRRLGILKHGLVEHMIHPRAQQLHVFQLWGFFRNRQSTY